MPFTGELGSIESALGNLALGVSTGFSPSAFGYLAHVLDSQTVRVVFNEPVNDSALNPSAYTFLGVSGPVPTYVPHAVSVEFYDADQTSVAITVDYPMTWSAIYSVTITGVFAISGNFITHAAYNFRANVPDSPQPVAAYLTHRGDLDIQFDRPVGSTSPAATAVLHGISGGSAPLILLPWDSTIPTTNIRFQLDPATPTDTSYFITYSGVIAISNNPGAGQIPLTLTNRVSPYTYTILTNVQIVDGAVDSISNDPHGLNRALINVWFSCPMYGPDITNKGNWSAFQQGAHPVVDTADNVVIVPFDLISLIAFCNQLKTQFNNHLVAANVHVKNAAPPPFDADVIVLANNLRAVFNAHLIAHNVHVTNDIVNTETLPKAIDNNSAIALINNLKTKFNNHRTQVGVHVANDLEYSIVTADATDIRTASILADEISAKLSMHVVSIVFHVIADFADVPTAPYSNAQIVYPFAADLAGALALLNEAQQKIASHYLNDRVHLYADTIHKNAPVTIGSQTVTLPYFVIDQPTAITVAVAMGSILNEHYRAEYPIPILSVRDWSSTATGRAFQPVDARTYLAQVEVPAVTALPYYEIKVTARSEDLSRTTNPLDFTGDIIIQSLDSSPRIIGTTIAPGQLSFRTNNGISIPELPSLSVNGPNAPIKISNVELSASIQALILATTDLMYSYQFHNGNQYGAGHKILDIVNIFLPNDFPNGSFQSLLNSINRVRDVYYLHSQSTTYHNFPDSNPVLLPYATDIPSALRLALALTNSFIQHNANVGVHNFAGAQIYSAKIEDTLVIDVPGMKELLPYTMSATVRNTFIDVLEGQRLKRFNLTASFEGDAQPPYIASAIPKSGVVMTDMGPKFEQDAVLLFFSKPIQTVPLAPSNLTVTGPPGLQVLASSWIDPQVVSLSVIGMTSAMYTIDVSGIQDVFGNPIVSV